MKEKHITGHLVEPLEIGNPAYIQIDKGLMQTSPVQHYIQTSSGKTRIITKNSCYVLTEKGDASHV